MINKLIRYLKGYLRIRISGNAVERFINTCSSKGIDIWDLEAVCLDYEMNISIKDYRKIRPVVRKTHTKIVIVKRTGFPFFLNKYRKRKTLFIGFVICILLIYFLSIHIWSINISGNNTYTTEMILDYLKDQNITTGIKRNEIDCSQIAAKLRADFDDIIWVSASVNGSKLILMIKENEDSIDLTTKDTKKEPYDLVSDISCEVTEIVLRNGILLIKSGESVKKGDVLVSGQIPVYNDAKEIISYQYCTADADIYGKVKLLYEDEISRTYYLKEYSGTKKTIYYIGAGKYRFVLGDKKHEYKHFTKYGCQKNMGIFSFGIETISHYEQKENNYADNEIQKLLSLNFHYYCEELEKKGVVILKNNVKIYTWSDRAKATGTLITKMPVGQLKKSEIIETGEHIDGNDGSNN